MDSRILNSDELIPLNCKTTRQPKSNYHKTIRKNDDTSILYNHTSKEKRNTETVERHSPSATEVSYSIPPQTRGDKKPSVSSHNHNLEEKYRPS